MSQDLLRAKRCAPTSTPTTLDRLRAILDHAHAHQLGEHLASTNVMFDTGVNLYIKRGFDLERPNYLPALHQWARTLADVTITAHRSDDGRIHLGAEGRTASGMPITVGAIASAREADLIGDTTTFSLPELAALATEVTE